jgi:hypothetical protein
MLQTPLGEIVLLIDGIEVEYAPNKLEMKSFDAELPSIHERYSIVIPYFKSDKIETGWNRLSHY